METAKPITMGGSMYNGPYDTGNVSFDSGMRRIDKIRKVHGGVIRASNDRMNETDNIF